MAADHVADDHVQPAVELVGDRPGQRPEDQGRQQGGQPDAADRDGAPAAAEVIGENREGQQAQPVPEAGQRQGDPQPAERPDRQHAAPALAQRGPNVHCASVSATPPPASSPRAWPAPAAWPPPSAAVRLGRGRPGRRGPGRGRLGRRPRLGRARRRRGTPLRRGRGRAPLGQQLDGALRGDVLDRVALAQRRVGLAVGHVRPEPALLEHDRLAAGRVVAELAQRRGGRAGLPAAGLGLGEQLPGLVERHREHLLFGLQGAAVVTLLDVRAIAPVLHRYGLAVQVAQGPGQRQQAQRVVQGDAVQVHRLQQRGGAGLVLRALLELLGHVGAEAAGLGHDRPAAGRVGAEDLLPAGPRQQLLRELRGQLVRRGALGHVGPLAVALQVGAVPADPHDDVRAGQRERAHAAGVDVGQVADELLEPLLALRAEVEPGQPRHPLGVALGDVVERVLHLGREVVVDELGEVLLQQRHHREGGERRDQRGALLEQVAAVEVGADHRHVGRRTADLAVFQLLDQRRLGVAGRRAGGVLGGGEVHRVQRVGLGQRRQAALVVVQLRVRVVGALDVGLQEPVEADDLARGAELGLAAGRRLGRLVAGSGDGDRLGRGRLAEDPDRHRLTGRVLHLRCHGPLPDQVIEAELVAGQAGPGRGPERVAGRADGLVRLLGALDLAGVGARLVRARTPRRRARWPAAAPR